MKKSFYGFLLCAGLVTLSVIWYTSYSTTVPVNAQLGCVPPNPDFIGNRWSTGATVTVKIHSAFTPDERTAIQEAF